MAGEVSDRLIDQRLRNRILEAIEILADGDDGVRNVGFQDYFEGFYGFIPHRDDGNLPVNSAFSAEERALVRKLSAILDDACDATPHDMTDEEFIATGWPTRVRPMASQALAQMQKRGRFREDKEEEAPSG